MKFPIERKPQMSPVPGGELLLLILQFIHPPIHSQLHSPRLKCGRSGLSYFGLPLNPCAIIGIVKISSHCCVFATP